MLPVLSRPANRLQPRRELLGREVFTRRGRLDCLVVQSSERIQPVIPTHELQRLASGYSDRKTSSTLLPAAVRFASLQLEYHSLGS